jgi:hypothetical protein
MSKLIQVRACDIKWCDCCGTLIAFHANRHGKRYPVDVFDHPKLGVVYHAHYGAYNNMTMWHDCKARLQEQQRNDSERMATEQQAKADAVAREYLPRLMALAKEFTPEREAEAIALAQEYKEALQAAGVQTD